MKKKSAKKVGKKSGIGSVLGPLKNRSKMEMRLSPDLLEIANKICVLLGVPKNALFTISVSLLAAKLYPILPIFTRRTLAVFLENYVQDVIKKIKNQP